MTDGKNVGSSEMPNGELPTCACGVFCTLYSVLCTEFFSFPMEYRLSNKPPGHDHDMHIHKAGQVFRSSSPDHLSNDLGRSSFFDARGWRTDSFWCTATKGANNLVAGDCVSLVNTQWYLGHLQFSVLASTYLFLFLFSYFSSKDRVLSWSGPSPKIS